MKYVIIIIGLLIVGSCCAAHDFLADPLVDDDGAAYPEWAHDHWVWLSSSQANQTTELALVEGYLSRNISVGAVNVDSQWSTCDNNFEFNTNKYPNASQMIEDFHSEGVRCIFWVTSAFNNDCAQFDEVKNKGYLMFNGTLVKWWHGVGGLVNYSNPEALSWWHSQMDNVLSIGGDGWKCDGTSPYTFELELENFEFSYELYRQYSNDYYRDFFDYSRIKNDDALIMARPVDAYWSFAPRDVVFSGWVGDQDPTFAGLRSAMHNMLRSAWRSYVGFGSDTGGYRGGGPAPYGRTPELFIRWAQLSALCPLFENGGDNEHRPWMFGAQIEDTYRRFVDIHYSLRPYLLSAGTDAYRQGVSIMKPIAKRTKVLPPSSYDYMLWHDILVSPIVEDNTTRVVHFPAGNNWIDWFNTSLVYQGGTSATLDVPLTSFPVFRRQGSMIATIDMDRRHPLRASVDFKRRNAEPLRLMITRPSVGSSASQSIVVRRWRGASQQFTYSLSAKDNVLHFSATAHERPFIVELSHVDRFERPSWSSLRIEHNLDRQILVIEPTNTHLGVHFDLQL
jgi:alpha-glucosidase (family GH31 glycosyl hydrolase)